MRKTYSQPRQEWDGFRPVMYSLDNFWELPLTEVRKTASGTERHETTIGGVLTLLAKQGIESLDQSGISTDVKTKTGDEIEFAGKPFHLEIAGALASLQRDGVDVYQTRWFYFDSDYCREDPIVSYSFFVLDVEQNRIVREDVAFHDDPNSAFDPKVFDSFDAMDWPWANMREWDGASARYWYRRFYTETRIGQLMVLRPDEPTLFYFDRRQSG